MIRKIILYTGVLLLLSSLVPAIAYGILNTGSYALFILGMLLVFWPKYRPLMKKNGKLRKFAVCIIAAGILYSSAISALMLKQAYFTQPDTGKEIAVIVLGGRIVDDQPSLMLRYRLDTARAYLKENPFAICIVTGGQGADEDYPEALVMRNYLAANGIEADRIIMEDKSVNTRENLRFAANLLPYGDMGVVIVTDGFHQLRASIFARAEGFSEIYSLSSRTPWGLIPVYWVRDMLGVAWAFVTV